MGNAKEMSVGKRILILRTSRGYSREYLAEQADISTKFLYEIEADKKSFSAKTLVRLADALDVSMDYIMTGKGSKKYEDEIAETLAVFHPNELKAVDELLKIVFELINGKV